MNILDENHLNTMIHKNKPCFGRRETHVQLYLVHETSDNRPSAVRSCCNRTRLDTSDQIIVTVIGSFQYQKQQNTRLLYRIGLVSDDSWEFHAFKY